MMYGDLIISKPKKQKDNTYEANIYMDTKKNRLTLNFENAFIVNKKSQEKNNYIFIVCKKANKTILEVNGIILDNVKANCKSWFKNELSEDLIEEFFTNNIIWDKQHGQVLRLKCLNDLEDVPINQMSNINITLTSLRFYKQKFTIEWTINQIELIELKDLENVEDSDSEEDIPAPLVEDIDSIKSNYTTLVKKKIEYYNGFIRELKSKYKELKETFEFPKVCAICDELDKLLE